MPPPLQISVGFSDTAYAHEGVPADFATAWTNSDCTGSHFHYDSEHSKRKNKYPRSPGYHSYELAGDDACHDNCLNLWDTYSECKSLSSDVGKVAAVAGAVGIIPGPLQPFMWGVSLLGTAISWGIEAACTKPECTTRS